MGKLEMTYDISTKDKNLKKLKAITETNLKSKISSIKNNSRRSKKSAARIERSKQILSRSCERKLSKKRNESKKKRNKVLFYPF
jgi:septal ring factor EnvC (AmiA/AmiB activator)